jgi:hypothetical protein
VVVLNTVLSAAALARDENFRRDRVRSVMLG